jgi:hypothetical protein
MSTSYNSFRLPDQIFLCNSHLPPRVSFIRSFNVHVQLRGPVTFHAMLVLRLRLNLSAVSYCLFSTFTEQQLPTHVEALLHP